MGSKRAPLPVVETLPDLEMPCVFCAGTINITKECAVTHSLPPCDEFLTPGEDSLDFVKKSRVRLASDPKALRAWISRKGN